MGFPTLTGPPDSIRSACGREKYQTLSRRPGLLAWIRLRWFVVVASIRDRHLPLP
jgi:hypothetical protein